MKKRGKILIVTDLFPQDETDYAGIYVVDYAHSVREWFDVHILHSRLVGKSAGTQQLNLFDLPVTRHISRTTKPSKLGKIAAYNSWFKSATKAGATIAQFDLIHAHGAALSGNVAKRIAQQQQIPFLITEHTGPFSTIANNPIRLKYAKQSVNSAMALLHVSEHSKNDINASGVNHANQTVTYNPVNDNIYSFRVKSDPTQFLFVSRLDEFKGGWRTVKAFHKSALSEKGWSLKLIGDGEEMAAIKEYVDTHKLDSVFLKGFKTKQEIASELHQSAALIFPSRHETFGLVAAESLCTGTPVIATNKTAPAEYITSSNGILVEPDSIEDIGSAMLAVAENHVSFDNQRVSQNAIDAFGMKSFGERLKDIYLQHIGG